MSTDPPRVSLASLRVSPYLNNEGKLPDHLAGKVGAYAIFDQAQTLQFVGYSRDVYLSLKQHLVRQPQRCYWLKVHTVDRPSRTALEALCRDWIEEQGTPPPGNGPEQPHWEQPIDVKAAMTPEERANYTNPEIDELTQRKILKNSARRLEAEILEQLAHRQVQEEIRFNPKLKEVGLLDLK
jgi:hypothetical protein